MGHVPDVSMSEITLIYKNIIEIPDNIFGKAEECAQCEFWSDA